MHPDLPLTDRERGAVEALLDSLTTALERRLPHSLELIGLRVDLGRKRNVADGTGDTAADTSLRRVVAAAERN